MAISKDKAISWCGTLGPKQGLVFDPPPINSAPPPAKHYAVYNSGNEPITIIVTMIEPAEVATWG